MNAALRSELSENMQPASTEAAARRLKSVARRTPLMLASKLSAELDNQIFLKREDLQLTNSFKIRGAYNKIAQLSARQLASGLIAVSAGNHAQGVALAAQMFGASATIVMPTTTPDVKITAVKSYGAKVILAGDNYSEASEYYEQSLAARGQTFIHPYDDEQVVAGQATVGREIYQDLPDASLVLVPIGGGGLIAGVASYLKAKNPKIRIIGVQSVESDAMARSLASGKLVSLKHVGTFSDGTAVKTPGQLTYKLVNQFVDDIVTVNLTEIVRAISDIYNEFRAVLEPAGALAVAGARALAASGVHGQRLVAIASGANISLDKLGFVAEQSRLASGLEALYSVRLAETPGALASFVADVVDGHNITEFSYRLAARSGASIFIGFRMNGAIDKHHFEQKLAASHYRFDDLTHDDFAQRHLRHMIGGASEEADNERLYEIRFPERAGALAKFLAALGNDFNISLFHFRGQGDDTSRVVIGFEASRCALLETKLKSTGYQFARVSSLGASQFL